MENEIIKIDIVPAIFIKYRENGDVVLRCIQGDTTVDRAFESTYFKKIQNLKYILLGISTGINYMKLKIIDGADYEELFLEKWEILTK